MKKSRRVRIAFITDLHLTETGKNYKGIDSRKNLISVMKDVVKREIDYIVIGGDISLREPSINANQFLKDVLDVSEISHFVIAGNHDDPSEINRIFGYKNRSKENYYVAQKMGLNLLFLDSSSGKIKNNQKKWIRDKIENMEGHVLMFCHHPILKTQVKYMDKKYPMKNRKQIEKILDRINKRIHIFSGHFHVERTTSFKKINQYVTPSLLQQIDPLSKDLKIDHTMPGYRIIEVKKDQISSYVRYIQ